MYAVVILSSHTYELLHSLSVINCPEIDLQMHFIHFLQVFWADNNDLGTIKYVHKNDSDHINILRRKTPGVTEMFMYNPTSQSKFTIHMSIQCFDYISFLILLGPTSKFKRLLLLDCIWLSICVL